MTDLAKHHLFHGNVLTARRVFKRICTAVARIGLYRKTRATLVTRAKRIFCCSHPWEDSFNCSLSIPNIKQSCINNDPSWLRDYISKSLLVWGSLLKMGLWQSLNFGTKERTSRNSSRAQPKKPPSNLEIFNSTSMRSHACAASRTPTSITKGRELGVVPQQFVRCLQGVLGWIFMPICGFELNCQLHVISIFNVCFWFLYFLLCYFHFAFHFVLRIFNFFLKSISAFCTNFAFRRISFGFKQKRLFAKKTNMSSFVAFLSGADQYGRWVPSEEVTASAYLGGSAVDFSQALFKHPVPLRWLISS